MKTELKMKIAFFVSLPISFFVLFAKFISIDPLTFSILVIINLLIIMFMLSVNGRAVLFKKFGVE